MTALTIVRRLGTAPQQRGSTNDLNCPDVFLLTDDRVGCIGEDLTDKLRDRLPPGASIGAHEKLVAIPLRTLRDAVPDILEAARYVQERAAASGPIADPGPQTSQEGRE